MKPISIITLTILTFAGAILRLYKLDFQCLWTEELYTLTVSKMSTVDILMNFDFTPFPSYLLSHFSYLIFNTDVSIRYPSVICGILLIPAAYWLGVTYKDEIVGLYMAMLTTISIPLLYYSQYARSYEMSILFFTLLLIFYIKTKRNIECPQNEWVFWILVVVNLWTHLFILIPVSLLCLDLIIDRYQRIFCAALVFVASLPLINIVYQVVTQRVVSGGANYGASPLQMLILTPTEFFNTTFLNIFFLAGIGLKLDNDSLKWRWLIVSVLTFVTGIICASFTPTMPRYIMGISMIILLMASVACVNLSRLIKIKHIEMIIFVIVTLVFIWMTWPNFESHFWVKQYVC
jgi:hypothetical protein